MVDMGQADRTLRVNRPALTYSWNQVENVSSAVRGEFCVIRQAAGRPELLRIENQRGWKEWAGAFSFLG